jgi:uncharacterized protein YdeI (YjbR/CyaY-like superfamily)
MVKAPDNSTHPKTRSAWRAWLSENHGRSEGVWFISYKKSARKPTVGYDEAVEEAVCFGWIDSKSRALDEERTMLWFAPRKPGTGWSRSNQERAVRLIAQGLMAPAGLAKIEAAKQDGSWAKLDRALELEVPPDLAKALAVYPEAGRNFDAFPPSVRRGILEWITGARRPETRARRVEETARLAAVNRRANQGRE